MKTEELSLNTLVDLIDHQLLLLPAFQRNFVWDDTKITLLFDSLINGIPIGAVTLAVPTFSIGAAVIDQRIGDDRGNTPDFEYYQVEKFKEFADEAAGKLGGPQECRLILDGQQRLTSIYRVLHARPRLFLAVREAANGFKSIKQLSEAVDEINLADSEGKMHISLDVARRQSQLRDKDFESEFLATKYGQACKEAGEARFAEELSRFCTLTRDLFTVFVDKAKVPCITSDAKEDSLIAYFERSNTKGEPLSFYDLLNAKTFRAFKSTKWKSLTAAREKLLSGLSVECRVPKFDEHFIRAKCYTQVKEKAGGNALNKGAILLHVDEDKLKKGFEESWNDFCKPIRWLHAIRLATVHDFMPFPLMLLPLYFFLEAHDFEADKISAAKKAFVVWWYWASVFSERYSYRTNEAAEEDIELLRQVAATNTRPKKLVDEKYVARLSNRLERPKQILALTGNTGHFQRAILQLGIYRHNSSDLFTATDLATLAVRQTAKGRRKRIDYHHIFPTAYCEKALKSGEAGNTICNIMYATTKTHRGDGDAPSKYLARWKKDKGIKIESLESHFMSKDMVKRLVQGSYDKKLQAFCGDRAELMCNEVRSVVDATQIARWVK